MPHILHLMKSPPHPAARDVLSAQARHPENRLTIVLLHDAPDPTPPLPGEVFRVSADGGQAPPYPGIDYHRLLDLIFAADTVIAW